MQMADETADQHRQRTEEPVDVLLFGSHPDDIEWGAGGTVLRLAQSGLSFGLIDLTRGEMGSRGTAEERDVEAQRAASHMGARFRENLALPDCAIVDSTANRGRIASTIRKHRPKLVLAPYWKDRHPDHAATGRLVRKSAIHCVLKKSSDPNPPHKPSAYLYYLLHHFKQPSFVVDVSDVYSAKLQVLQLHVSQFAQTAQGFGVIPLGMSDYLFGLESRDRFFGSLVGVHHGEAFVSETPLKLGSIGDVLSLLHAGRQSIDQVLTASRSRLRRLSPRDASEATLNTNALLVDIRPAAQREAEGSIPGALVVERNVLEWRFDPTSSARLPVVNDHAQPVIIFCSQGYTSSLAAASLQNLGLSRATDIIGGFQAWSAEGLPTIPGKQIKSSS
jgi:N-acetylglucosamine malate deacetylase 1